MWPLLALGAAALGAVAYAVTREDAPEITAPTRAPRGGGGFMVAWGRTGTDHWYASMRDVQREARRLGDDGTITKPSGKLVGRVDARGTVHS